MKNFLIIGAGGIGYHLAEPLVRFLNFELGNNAKVYVVDGDTIEDRNLERQHTAGNTGRNKAEVLAENINARIRPTNSVSYIPHFISPTTINDAHFKEVLQDGVTFFVCVDNNATRVLVENLVARLPNATMISGGNDFYKGQAQLYVRKNGKNETPTPSDVNPEILELEDTFPDEVGCDVAVVSEPQLIFANNSVACSMLNLWYSQCHTNPTAERLNEICIDVQRASAMPYVRKSLKPVLTK